MSTRSDLPYALVRAAEALIAERGADVPLRDITQLAGAGNASAVNYHFGDREGLVKAILRKHEPQIETRRHALLDAYEAADQAAIRPLAAALVEPLAAELGNEDGGAGYLQLISDLYNRPHPIFSELVADDAGSIRRWRKLVMPMLEPEAVRLHRRFDAMRFTVSELARRARVGRKDHRLFTSQLTDLVAGLLLTPVSEDTRRLVR